ncbi:hypothetical protein Tco_1348035, partial [Tanacetum coccineum]
MVSCCLLSVLSMNTANHVSQMGMPKDGFNEAPADTFPRSVHVNPSKATLPACFDIQPDDYISYLCGLGYTPKLVQMIVGKA